MQPIKEYLTAKSNYLTRFDRHVDKRVARFLLIDLDLYKRGYSFPLLKFLSKEQAEYLMREIHHGVCGLHSRHHTMASREPIIISQPRR